MFVCFRSFWISYTGGFERGRNDAHVIISRRSPRKLYFPSPQMSSLAGMRWDGTHKSDDSFPNPPINSPTWRFPPLLARPSLAKVTAPPHPAPDSLITRSAGATPSCPPCPFLLHPSPPSLAFPSAFVTHGKGAKGLCKAFDEGR